MPALDINPDAAADAYVLAAFLGWEPKTGAHRIRQWAHRGHVRVLGRRGRCTLYAVADVVAKAADA